MSQLSETNKEIYLLNELKEFYKNEENAIILIKYLNGSGLFSIRVIEWFCQNYAKNNCISFQNEHGEHIDIHKSFSYHICLYNRNFFDPFKRTSFSHEIEFITRNGILIKSTVGQLNFFKWYITYGIYNYFEIHKYTVLSKMKGNLQCVNVNYSIETSQNHSLIECNR